MCLNKTHSNVRIAGKDIYTFKRLKSNLTAPYQYKFQYKLNFLYKTEIKHSRYDRKAILEGFHSLWATTLAYNEVSYFDREKNIIVLCKIPKGSRYYIGNYSDIVSNQIIIEKIIFEPKLIKPKQTRKGIKTWSSLTKQSEQYLKENYPNNIINAI